jgi:GH15 family glucan-1,4-alpha-glucosidase
VNDLDLAAIGNCGYGALINRQGRVVWACLPHFDDDPLFCSLLHEADPADPEARGFYEIALENLSHAEQDYEENTAILVTTLHDTAGSAVEITDFAPRFRHYGRFHHPPTLVRIVRPLRGTPRIRIRLRPAGDYGERQPEITMGSNHIRYVTTGITLRLTTNASVPFVERETPFVLLEPTALFLGSDETLAASVLDTSREMLDRTREYWLEYVRALNLPFEWQDEVIRAAITLKLCSYEDSGAIIAALTTSIPEAPHSGRNWDYRFCWLRDAYFVVAALNRLGATQTLERFLEYITNLAAASPDGYLQPVYGVHLDARLEERRMESLTGYRGMGPVRVGNLAYQQVQNDVYGSVILAVRQVFFDRRLRRGTLELFERLQRLGEQAARRFDQPDAGLWELRRAQRVHTFSSVMCWAACDRLARIASRLGLTERARHWRRTADEMHAVICARAWRPDLDRFAAAWDGDGADASLFLLADLSFLSADDPRFASTVRGLADTLRSGELMYRYTEDDFGRPETAFTVCTFWYVDALAAMGRRDEARALFERLLSLRNRVGLYSEDIHPATGELWGNFPQTYSMVGLINSAMKLSQPWESAF